MAYDTILAERIGEVLYAAGVAFTQKKMFGGVAFMVRKKMCVGVLNADLMVRFDPAVHEEIVLRTGARDMEFTGRPMRGYVFVDPSGTRTSPQLLGWMTLALEFNPRAVSSKRSRSKKKGRRT